MTVSPWANYLTSQMPHLQNGDTYRSIKSIKWTKYSYLSTSKGHPSKCLAQCLVYKRHSYGVTNRIVQL